MVSPHDLNHGAEIHMFSNYVKLLVGPLVHGRSINWIKRLEIAEDAAKGL